MGRITNDEMVNRMRSMGVSEAEIAEHIKFRAEWDKETAKQKEKEKEFFDALPGFQVPRAVRVGNATFLHHHVVASHEKKGWVCASCGAEMTEKDVWGKDD